MSPFLSGGGWRGWSPPCGREVRGLGGARLLTLCPGSLVWGLLPRTILSPHLGTLLSPSPQQSQHQPPCPAGHCATLLLFPPLVEGKRSPSPPRACFSPFIFSALSGSDVLRKRRARAGLGVASSLCPDVPHRLAAAALPSQTAALAAERRQGPARSQPLLQHLPCFRGSGGGRVGQGRLPPPLPRGLPVPRRCWGLSQLCPCVPQLPFPNRRRGGSARGSSSAVLHRPGWGWWGHSGREGGVPVPCTEWWAARWEPPHPSPVLLRAARPHTCPSGRRGRAQEAWGELRRHKVTSRVGASPQGCRPGGVTL